jgi:hypothetical protein
VTDRKTLDQMTSNDLDQLYKERDEARQGAAAIAAQRDRLRQRMNALADRWETALPGQPHHGFAEALRAEISVAPFDPDGAMTVQEYTERGRRLWAFRCWGTETCDGWLGLGHHTQTSALLERERHVAEEHGEPTAEARLSHLQATSQAAGILLTRTTDERDRRQAAIARVRDLHYQDGAHCAVCTTDFGRLNAPWPCDTIRALDAPAPLTDHDGRVVCTCTWDTSCGCGTSPHYEPAPGPAATQTTDDRTRERRIAQINARAHNASIAIPRKEQQP